MPFGIVAYAQIYALPGDPEQKAFDNQRDDR